MLPPRALRWLSAAAVLTCAPANDADDFRDDAYVELRRDAATGGFLKMGEWGWDVWPRKGGRSFKGFLGYGYRRMTARGGRLAEGITPADWRVAAFPIAPTGPGRGGESFTSNGHRTHRGDYRGLVGKTLRFTIGGLGGLDCGCNANFYAVKLGAGCDASGNNGALCEEFDFFEGNKYSWHTTIHVLNDRGNETDAGGLATGYGGVLPTWPGFPSFDGDEYGPGGSMIDTERDFYVAASFPRGEDGELKGLCVELSQDGKPSMQQPLFMHLYAYNGSKDLYIGNGIEKMQARLQQGITMLSSMWRAGGGNMRWLDGAAHSDGPAWMGNFTLDGKCDYDGACSPYQISNVQVEDLDASQRAGAGQPDPAEGLVASPSPTLPPAAPPPPQPPAVAAPCAFADAPNCICSWIQDADACADSSGACYAPCREANPSPGCFCPGAGPRSGPPSVPAAVALVPATARDCAASYQQCGGTGWALKACCDASYACVETGDAGNYQRCEPDTITAVEDRGPMDRATLSMHRYWEPWSRATWTSVAGFCLLGTLGAAALRRRFLSRMLRRGMPVPGSDPMASSADSAE